MRGTFPTRLAALAAAGLLAACTTLGPDYQEPEVAWLADWQTDLYGQLRDPQRQSDVDLSFWWQVFDDATLNGLIETARRENPDLQIAGLRILESRAQLGIAGSNLYPQLQQVNGAATYIDSRQSGGAVDNDNSSTAYQAGFDIGWELDFWGRFQRGVESADAAFFASITNQQDVQVLLAAQVADLYFSYRTTRALIDIARKNAEIQKRSLDITERLYKGGQQSELDLQQAKAQYLTTLSTVPPLEIRLTQTRNALATLLARPPRRDSGVGGGPGGTARGPEGGYRRDTGQAAGAAPGRSHRGLVGRRTVRANWNRGGRLLPRHKPAGNYRLVGYHRQWHAR